MNITTKENILCKLSFHEYTNEEGYSHLSINGIRLFYCKRNIQHESKARFPNSQIDIFKKSKLENIIRWLLKIEDNKGEQ